MCAKTATNATAALSFTGNNTLPKSQVSYRRILLLQLYPWNDQGIHDFEMLTGHFSEHVDSETGRWHGPELRGTPRIVRISTLLAFLTEVKQSRSL